MDLDGTKSPHGNWLVYGDFNHIEFTEDSVRPMPLLDGFEQCAWNRLVDKLDLLDNRLIAVTKFGPHFTCQAVHWHRLDQSCLDQSYCCNRGH